MHCSSVHKGLKTLTSNVLFPVQDGLRTLLFVSIPVSSVRSEYPPYKPVVNHGKQGVMNLAENELQPKGESGHAGGRGFESFTGNMKKFAPFQVRWNECLGDPACPYMRRWVINAGLFSIRLHQWYRSDDKRFMHDHAWDFATIVLRGGYTDVSEHGRDALRAGSVRFRKAEHRHYVEVPADGCLSLLICMKPRRNWGFWVKGRLLRPLKFFSKHGHPACDEQ